MSRPRSSLLRAALIVGLSVLVCGVVGSTVAGCTSDADCEAMCQCQQRGKCGAVGSKCEPTRAEHCRRSDSCKLMGLCTLRDGQCVAASSADCAGATNCKRAGMCNLQGDRCVR